MSADNFYMVRQHPWGGFVAVMGFASDEEPIREVDPINDPRFDQFWDALMWAHAQDSEYGVEIHPELMEVGNVG